MKVLLTTSGTGSRLGELTKYTNKALIRIGKKPALSYIIDSYPTDTEFVITLGYKGEHVRDFLELAYPARTFVFITVDKYEGLGTSLGYSMLQAKDELQCPFVYHACDTIVEGFTYPNLSENWATGILVQDTTQYTSFSLDKEKYITHFNPKSAEEWDLVHIGLIGVKDYQIFWQTMERLYKADPNNSSLNDTITFSDMIERGCLVRGITVPSWLDIGNPSALADARAKISDRFDNLDKVDESLFFFDAFVIKFFADEKKVHDRVARGKSFGSITPETLEVCTNFYKYEFVQGELYSEVATVDDFKKFLKWSQKHLWRSVSEVNQTEFRVICRDFYEKKTKERIKKIETTNKITDKSQVINGEHVPSLSDMLSQIDFEWLSDGVQTQFHGDYILENILKVKDGYCLLDWRQDFGGLLKGGDMYYDLAKLSHNLVVNHEIISKDLFLVKVENDSVICTINRKDNLVGCERALFDFLEDEGLEIKKVKILRALIWLNMSPLHHDPFNTFLYYFGKYNLWLALK